MLILVQECLYSFIALYFGIIALGNPSFSVILSGLIKSSSQTHLQFGSQRKSLVNICSQQHFKTLIVFCCGKQFSGLQQISGAADIRTQAESSFKIILQVMYCTMWLCKTVRPLMALIRRDLDRAMELLQSFGRIKVKDSERLCTQTPLSEFSLFQLIVQHSQVMTGYAAVETSSSQLRCGFFY